MFYNWPRHMECMKSHWSQNRLLDMCHSRIGLSKYLWLMNKQIQIDSLCNLLVIRYNLSMGINIFGMFLLSSWGMFMLDMRQHIGSSTDNNLLDRLCN